MKKVPCLQNGTEPLRRQGAWENNGIWVFGQGTGLMSPLNWFCDAGSAAAGPICRDVDIMPVLSAVNADRNCPFPPTLIKSNPGRIGSAPFCIDSP